MKQHFGGAPPRSSAAVGRTLILVFTCLAFGGCRAPAPRFEERATLPFLDSPPATLYYRDLDADRARLVLDEVVGVHTQVTELLGLQPPRVELVVYEPRDETATVRETDGQLYRDDRTGLWNIGFCYGLTDGPRPLEQLIGTTAHEIGEATVLLQVTVLDPYLRWLHDGIAELVEHEVMRKARPRAALTNLEEAAEFLEERRSAGARWADLTRWRQLAPWIIRSHVFVDSEENLSLEQIPKSLGRVRTALGKAQDPIFKQGLQELDGMLRRAQSLRSRPWAADEVRVSREHRGLAFYKLSFAYCLSVERNSPGTARRFVTALAKQREEDPVLTAAEAWELFQEAAQSFDLPAPNHYTLAAALDTLRRERERLGGR